MAARLLLLLLAGSGTHALSLGPVGPAQQQHAPSAAGPGLAARARDAAARLESLASAAAGAAEAKAAAAARAFAAAATRAAAAAAAAAATPTRVAAAHAPAAPPAGWTLLGAPACERAGRRPREQPQARRCDAAASRRPPPEGPTPGDAPVTFYVMLKQRGGEELLASLAASSDPTAPTYGRHLSFAQLTDMVVPAQARARAPAARARRRRAPAHKAAAHVTPRPLATRPPPRPLSAPHPNAHSGRI